MNTDERELGRLIEQAAREQIKEEGRRHFAAEQERKRREADAKRAEEQARKAQEKQS
jgi:hypothetical protein